jgi:hypothetical protein
MRKSERKVNIGKKPLPTVGNAPYNTWGGVKGSFQSANATGSYPDNFQGIEAELGKVRK